MFSRIMSMVLGVILLVTVGLTGVCWMTLRNQQINAKLKDLTKEAREIAYLAAQNSASTAGLLFGTGTATTQYIRWKSQQVYEEYGAHKDELQDLLLFVTSKEKKYVTLKEYVARMAEGQTKIYFASGETVEKIALLPQVETAVAHGY